MFQRVSVSFVLVLLLNSAASAQSHRQTANPVADITQQLRAGNYGAAVQLADAALHLQPNDPRLWTLKGIALSAESPDHPVAALPVLNRALSLAPTYLPALEAAAQVEYTLGDDRARGHLDGVLEQQPSNPTAHAMLGVLDFRAGKFAAATNHFGAAQQVIANQPLALSQYAASMANSGDLAGALPVFAKIVSLQPGNDNARYNLALSEFRSHRLAEASESLAPLLASQQPGEESLTLAAEICEASGQTQEALNLLRRSILLYPKSPDAYIYLAHLSFAHSSIQVGVDILNAGIRQLPDDARLYLSRGVLLSQTARNDEAAADFDKAAALDPQLTLAHTARGVAQSQQHHGEEALATFRQAARLHPDDALTQYLLAEALSNGNPAPDTADGKEELQAALAAVHLNAGMADAQNLLATIYLRQEDFLDAAQHSSAALQIHPNDQQALYHLILTARKGVNKDRLPELVRQLAAAKNAAPDPTESPRGYLIEAR